MLNGQIQVKNFMQIFGQRTPDRPIQLDVGTAKLRAQLILEEAFETIVKGLGLQVTFLGKNQAVSVNKDNLSAFVKEFTRLDKKDEVNLTELADGLADLSYVADKGTAVAAGINMEPVHEEVHRSNMSKLWSEVDLKQVPLNTVITKIGEGKWMVKNGHGKVIKSPSYSPAQISAIISEQQQ